MSTVRGSANKSDPKWKWCLRFTYNDTVKLPKVPGGLAIEVVVTDDAARDFELEASKNRTDVNVEVTPLSTWCGF